MEIINTHTLAQIQLDRSRLLFSCLSVLLYSVLLLLFLGLGFAIMFLKAKTGWMRKRGLSPEVGFTPSTDTASITEKATVLSVRQECECPYDYILQIYGSNHFTKIVNILDPQLKSEDPNLFQLILEVMDTIHFGAILVDDVADNTIC